MASADSSRVQQRTILTLLLFLAAASWVVLIWRAFDDTSPMGLSMGLSAPLFLTIWVIMMIAMMFPTAAPMIVLFHRIQAEKRRRGEAFVATWIFASAYLAVWTVAGIFAFAGAAIGEYLVQWMPEHTSARVGGGLFIVAGLYQLSPLKRICLSHCRSPVSFIMTSWRDGAGGAVWMGVLHGLHCLGCCWLLFAVLVAVGLMNITAMAAITAVVFAEKVLPRGRQVASLVGAGLIAVGLIVVFTPSALKTPDLMGLPLAKDGDPQTGPMPEM